MKTKTIILLGSLFLLTKLSATAQDSIKQHSAIKQINKTSAQADNISGKKIQQQNLSKNRFIKPDTLVTAPVPPKKKNSKQKRKRS